MNISQTAEYALRAVVCLAGQTEAQTTQLIAECTGVPQSYLPKVLQPLARAKLVSAQRGVRGGYLLQRDADEITALDVVNCVDPLRRRNRCNDVPADHDNGYCPLHRLLDTAIATTESAFGAATIQSLAYITDGRPAVCGRLNETTQRASDSVGCSSAEDRGAKQNTAV